MGETPILTKTFLNELSVRPTTQFLMKKSVRGLAGRICPFHLAQATAVGRCEVQKTRISRGPQHLVVEVQGCCHDVLGQPFVVFAASQCSKIQRPTDAEQAKTNRRHPHTAVNMQTGGLNNYWEKRTAGTHIRTARMQTGGQNNLHHFARNRTHGNIVGSRGSYCWVHSATRRL